ncbi:dTDP-4-dehydrorhamnose 3,5-epimerase family protein [Chitinibacter bivalviorum]|uniref:dTDP-4-dehydrorhamnose 3,5-epimerase n=1 Tax=Chitinibacter bivalviorum TaxID=2739434 RepID=A0A7H9BGD4_9NEIS|nr:dTDP-4-dehydrorhamnose 3,5-epimerase [Chitinibacter bivalviorum]QLG87001.1 dTDP-4-dehydrorhamnose 3,5-epimerase family protein [Chitinibacter bivalviorum]
MTTPNSLFLTPQILLTCTNGQVGLELQRSLAVLGEVIAFDREDCDLGKPSAILELVRCTRGEEFDVAVDLRQSSPTLGKWIGVTLSEENKHLLWIPEGFAHSFLVLSDIAKFLYKTKNYWFPEEERTILWCDDYLNIFCCCLNPLFILKKMNIFLFKNR